MTTDHQDGFSMWFARFASGQNDNAMAPREWQAELARDPVPRSRVIRIPTGYGKTLGALAAWLYHRVEQNDERWPRRLVWVLPMRVLVEQTADEVRACLNRLDLLWQPGMDRGGKVGVHLLMGGVDEGGEWNLFPEECAVFIATQDMALSRALNRGYAAGRARWPMEFGLLSQDVLWVFDEVQLMDVGLATSAQLQAFFDDDSSRSFRPRLSWWMSATLQPAWLRSVDTELHHPAWAALPTELTSNALASGLATIRKGLNITSVPASDHEAFAETIRAAHESVPADGEYGRITLVVCNTVERACRTFDALQALSVVDDLRLLHSRFRPHERAAWKTTFLSRDACRRGADRIIVATQVVEAGVDISATTLVSELAPWSSLVQRFGRCARYGGSGNVVVVDRGRDEKTARPYVPAEVDAARWAIDMIVRRGGDVGIASIEVFEQELDGTHRQQLYPYEPRQLLQRREFDELFDTTPDLTGADLDVSSFIRSGEERDVSVFWVDLPSAVNDARPVAPPPNRRPSGSELCGVPFLAARDWLCGPAKKDHSSPRLLPTHRAWVWDWLGGEWRVADRAALIPGVVVCVASDSGGYHTDGGFDPESRDPVPVVAALPMGAQGAADDLEDSEELSAAAAYQTIATHNSEVAEEAARLAAWLVPGRIVELIALAGRWHDVGKAHPAFQAIIEARGPYVDRVDLAKAPDGSWQVPCRYESATGEMRRGFRHELASCLALFEVLRTYDPTHPALLGPWASTLALMGDGEVSPPIAPKAVATDLERLVLDCTVEEFDLLAYLVLAHHGKVRVAMHAGPKDQEYIARDDRGLPIRGVREGDVLPSITLDGMAKVRPFTLTLAPASLGLSSTTGRSWRDRTGVLLHGYGPGGLAYLEALLIAADRRASKRVKQDPLLAVFTVEGTP